MNPENCPVCNKPFVTQCRCMLGDRKCPDGHEWHGREQAVDNETKELQIGSRIYVPCEVKPGQFSSESLVKVESEAGIQTGFVDNSYLKTDVHTDKKHVTAVVRRIEGDKFYAKVQGQFFPTGMYAGYLDNVHL